MVREKIQLPGQFDFTVEIPIRVDDINYGGHLGNDAVLKIIHDARIHYLKKNGFSEMDIGGCGLMMVDATLNFRSEGFHGDKLVIEIAFGEFSNSSFELFYKLTNKVTGKIIAAAKTGMVSYDYQLSKIVQIPAIFKEKFQKK